jgi:hypothetical protein
VTTGQVSYAHDAGLVIRAPGPRSEKDGWRGGRGASGNYREDAWRARGDALGSERA